MELYYARHMHNRKRIALNQRSHINRNRQAVLDFLLKNPCIDCGASDPRVLEFDHSVGQKIANIPDMVKNAVSLETLFNEIHKCVIRCANCHRIRTRRQGNWWLQ